MNDAAALTFNKKVPAIFCGLKSRLHFTQKLTLLYLNLLKERSYRTVLEILKNQTSAKKKIQLAKRNEKRQRVERCQFEWKTGNRPFSKLLSSSQSLSLAFFLDKPLKFPLEYTGQSCWNRLSLSLTGGSLKKTIYLAVRKFSRISAKSLFIVWKYSN